MIDSIIECMRQTVNVDLLRGMKTRDLRVAG